MNTILFQYFMLIYFFCTTLVIRMLVSIFERKKNALTGNRTRGHTLGRYDVTITPSMLYKGGSLE